MKHARRILEVAVAVIVAAYSTAIASPVVTNLLAAHPADAAYVSLAAGIVVAIYKAIRDLRRAGRDAPAPPSGGSSMGAT